MTDGRISAREPYAFETASGQTIYLHPVRRILLGKIRRMEAEWEAQGKVVTLPTRRFKPSAAVGRRAAGPQNVR